MRPDTHWRGFWAAAVTIAAVLARKLASESWVRELSRQRQQYWWRGYQRQSRFSGPVVPLPQLLAAGVIAATHSLTHRAIEAFDEPAHRIFAVTPAYSGP
jgi:hypothetical protein